MRAGSWIKRPMCYQRPALDRIALGDSLVPPQSGCIEHELLAATPKEFSFYHGPPGTLQLAKNAGGAFDEGRFVRPV